MDPSQQPDQPVTANNSSRKTAMRIIIAVISIALIIGGLLWWYLHSQNQQDLEQDTPSVSITADGYSPSTIKIKANQEVTWTNTDSTKHELAADSESLPDFGGAEALSTGDTYTYVFDQAGTYRYYDPTDAAKNGTVIVE